MDLDKLRWKTVGFEDIGASVFNANFEGLIGIEECSDYGVVSKRKSKKKILKEKGVKRKSDEKPVKRPPKKLKNNSFGDFEVENIESNTSLSPSKVKNSNKENKINEKIDKTNKKDNNTIRNKTEKGISNIPKEAKTKSSVTSTKKIVNNVSEKKSNAATKSEKISNVATKSEKKSNAATKSEKISNVTTKSEKKSNAATKSEKISNVATKSEKKSNVTTKSEKKKAKNKRKRDRIKLSKQNCNDDENETNDVKQPENEDDDEDDDDVEDNPRSVSLKEMHSWSAFNLPEIIVKGLAHQGFKTPTTIQELTLPAALFGRRDILGAAETGSGKTLAFGLPILNGILRLKEAALKGEKDSSIKVKSNPQATAFVNEQAKIINYNKLTKDERKTLMQKIKGKSVKKRKRVFKKDSEDESDDDDSEIMDDSSDEDVSESDDEEMSVDDEPDKEPESNDDDSEDDEKIDPNELAILKDAVVDDQTESEVENVDEDQSEDTDFDEREEQVEGVNEKGIGCVKVIDNLSSMDLPVPINPRKDMKPLYALILTPTRELAIQVKNHLVAAAKFTDISVAVVVGGMSQEKQERLLNRHPEIVVATPGRLWQMLQQGNDHLSQIQQIRYLAIDETDRMMEKGHFEELHHLLDVLNDESTRRKDRQTFVFSATLTMVHDLPKHLKGKKVSKKGKILNRKVEKMTSAQKLKKVIEMLGITDPKVVDVTTQNQGASSTLLECRISCPIDHKDFYMYYVLKRHPGRTIVFCNSIGCVKRLAQLFGMLECRPLPLHANMPQRQRLKNLDRFRDDSQGLLVATDVAARGLDIPDVDHVIHYQVPRTAENYVHRSGRTARASKEGITILIMEPGEVQNYTKMCKTLSKKEDLPHFPIDGSLLTAVKQRVELARELDHFTLQLRKDTLHRGWLEKAAKEMDMLIDDRDSSRVMESQTASELKNVLMKKKKQLSSLLSSPLFPKGFSFKFPSMNSGAEESLMMGQGENAVQAMKSAMESGKVKKLKNTTRNEAIFNLEKAVKEDIQKLEKNLKKSNGDAGNQKSYNEKLSKNKWKKMRRNKDTL